MYDDSTYLRPICLGVTVNKLFGFYAAEVLMIAHQLLVNNVRLSTCLFSIIENHLVLTERNKVPCLVLTYDIEDTGYNIVT